MNIGTHTCNIRVTECKYHSSCFFSMQQANKDINLILHFFEDTFLILFLLFLKKSSHSRLVGGFVCILNKI
jgi:hypothetical protein